MLVTNSRSRRQLHVIMHADHLLCFLEKQKEFPAFDGTLQSSSSDPGWPGPATSVIRKLHKRCC